MTSLRKILWKNYMAMEKWILPSRENPQKVYRSTIEKNLNNNTDWLDLGCGYKLIPLSIPRSVELQNRMVQRCNNVFGIDGDFPSLARNEIIKNRVHGDICRLPFRNESFDLITANMVVEHIESPDILLSEIHRVLRPGGLFIFHTPNKMNYKIQFAKVFPESLKKIIIKYLQNREEEDVYPTHYRLNSVKDQAQKAENNGFQTIRHEMLQGPADSVMLGPFVLFELFVMKLLSYKLFHSYRSNIVTVQKKLPAK